MSPIHNAVKRQVQRVCASTPLRRLICWRVSCREPLVAITFDDGPDPHFTPVVLDILAKYEVPATFFLLGTRVERHPDTVRQVVQDGHEVGNHSYDHSKHNLCAQAELCDATLVELGISTRLFRPPGGEFGALDLFLLARAGYTTVMWSLDAVDSRREEGKWHGDDPRYEDVAPGDIVLMHDDNATCVRDLPILLEILKRKGLQAVVVSRLLGTRSHRPGPHKVGSDGTRSVLSA